MQMKPLNDQLWGKTTAHFQRSGDGHHDDEDDWCCGIQSAYRILKHLGHSGNLGSLIGRIGQVDLRIDLNFCDEGGIVRDVCNWIGLGWVCDKVCDIFVIRIPQSFLDIGRPANQLAAAITSQTNYKARYETGSSLQRIRSLVFRGHPVMVLVYTGHTAFWLKNQNCLAGTNICVPNSFPGFHWLVVSGYDASRFNVYDTDSDQTYWISQSAFYQNWNFQGNCQWLTELGWAVPSGGCPGWGHSWQWFLARLDVFQDLRARSLIYFDSPIPEPFGTDGVDCSNVNFPKIQVRFTNECTRTIHLLLHYKTIDPQYFRRDCRKDNSKDGIWITRAWWPIKPGETVYVADTQNRFFYYYAEDRSTGTYWGGGDITVQFHDDFYKTNKIEGPSTFKVYTHRFTCTNGLPKPRNRIQIKNDCHYSPSILSAFQVWKGADAGWKLYWWYRTYVGEITTPSSSTAGHHYANRFYWTAKTSDSRFTWIGDPGDHAAIVDGKYTALREKAQTEWSRVRLRLVCPCDPIDCLWGPPQDWSDCQYLSYCGRDCQVRYWPIAREANACGAPCQGSSFQTRSCDR